MSTHDDEQREGDVRSARSESSSFRAATCAEFSLVGQYNHHFTGFARPTTLSTGALMLGSHPAPV